MCDPGGGGGGGGRGARFVCHLYGQQSVTAMLSQLQWEELAQRRLKARVIMCYKITNGLVCVPSDQFSTGRYSTRSRTRGGFTQLVSVTDYYKHSYFPATIRAWNTLPADLTGATSLEQFKTGLRGLSLEVEKPY